MHIIIIAILLILAILYWRKIWYSALFVRALFSPKTWDAQTDAEIALLHPSIRQKTIRFINTADNQLGIKLRIIDGYRTFGEQEAEYAKGRTAPGDIVTNAEPGESYHNYGLAWDVQPQRTLTSNEWQQLGTMAEVYGFRWGGKFISLDDKPHFEADNIPHHSELLALVNKGKTTYGYVNLGTV
ncbi:M15 family metallopeptidase [Bacteroidales bacterium AH-315-I05]|nr:M15 family metallopeptidase [Bacteroidales bacterium AH-315-I05]